MKQAITELKGTKVTWVDVRTTGKEELATLKRRFKFLEIDLKDCAPPLQRPKIVERPSYLFMILLFPVFDPSSRELKPVEIDLFISKNYLVTVHTHTPPPLARLFERAATDKALRMTLLGETPGKLLYHLLDELLDTCFPMLVHIANDVDATESRMTEVHDRGTIHEIFRLKTNIVNFKKAMQPHKMIMRKLIGAASKFFATKHLEIYFGNLVDHTKEIWDSLELQNDTLNAIEDTHLSLLNFRSGDIIRVLTLFAVIVFPLTLMAAIFGMNTINMPIIGHPFDFWIIIALMIAGVCGMIAYFKLKRWL
ncbi:magnesium transporter CorA family protein [Candidatus Uhrbacteria bacterium]|nr:magnesium transporter CorA family protein [Candidatus Uhrbacteria bacterium]